MRLLPKSDDCRQTSHADSQCKSDISAKCLAPDSDVSRIVLRVSSGVLIDDGLICRCDDDADRLHWDEDNKMALTWYHHERTDWLIQYQFCTTKSRKRKCLLEDDVAVVIKSPKDSWNPTLQQWICSCLNGRYHMDSWILRDNIRPGKQFWEYHYTCDKRPCDVGQPCVRHYLNRAASQTIGFKFLCTCPEGRLCQSSSEGKPQAYETDGHDKDTGPFILRYCRPVHGWDRQPWK
ncbi:hypothetical protein LSH36_138g01048 [Paralvinella palmiformis]|uniref:Uncharacterized protein n=1 Tax=Paralvinella palmiformis TaxID=53620 RepID=A0AAD9NAL2_9ANNE|nr:hypothetical protein LSH36_138g01048 [Paralvinella palmiformis]